MVYNPKKKEYNMEYEKKNLKRIPLNMQISDYEQLKNAANNVNETVNGYIKKAIQQRISSGK